MSSYRRPRVGTPDYLDSTGRVIPYGRRWAGSPPEYAYSVVTHPERFAPLHTVADTLIAHLRETYDVTADEGGPAIMEDLSERPAAVMRLVRLRPRDDASAGLTFRFSDHPGVRVYAGLLHDFPFPVCACDACDSSWGAEVEALEELIDAVVRGRFREWIELRDNGPWLAFSFDGPSGRRSGGTLARGVRAARVVEVTRVLNALPDGWAAWPRRHEDAGG